MGAEDTLITLEDGTKTVEEAHKDGVEIMGYTAWGCIDLVSFTTAEVRKRYGMIYVDLQQDGSVSLDRYKKKSFYWYKDIIESNGANLKK